MPPALTDHVSQWCQTHGWTDLFVERYEYWAFPPGGVMPTPIPTMVVAGFVQDRTQKSQVVYASTILVAILAAVLSYWQQSPMPLTCAFCVGALGMAFADETL